MTCYNPADFPVMQTERLTLRAPKPGDWPVWEAFAASPRARFIGGPLDTGKGWRAFCHIVGMWAVRGHGSFVFTRKGDDAPLGLTGPWTPADWPENELGWTVWDASVEGTGFAHEAALRARRFAFETLGWETAVSYIAPGNARSIALARRLGAVLDDAASAPHPDDLVFRHPAPQVPA